MLLFFCGCHHQTTLQVTDYYFIMSNIFPGIVRHLQSAGYSMKQPQFGKSEVGYWKYIFYYADCQAFVIADTIYCDNDALEVTFLYMQSNYYLLSSPFIFFHAYSHDVVLVFHTNIDSKGNLLI